MTVRLPGQRLLAVDAVRGIAALAVVLYHIPVELRKAAHIPVQIDLLFSNGHFGVDAFFVLSGFVISMSVAGGLWVPSYFPRFLLRRSVRLDPSYWCAIALELLLGWAGARFLSDVYPFPTRESIFAHFVYLQGILGHPQISEVFWTLCFEIQFYILLVGLLVLSARPVVERTVGQRALLGTAFALLVGSSLLIRSDVLPLPIRGLVLVRLYQFGIGVVTYLWATRRLPSVVAILSLGVIVGTRALAGAWIECLVLAVAAVVCFWSMRGTAINKFSSWAAVQYLGRISYSLYLYHGSIVGRTSAVVLLLMPRLGISVLPVIGIIGAVALSVVFSWIMYRIIELPTMRLSKRVSMPESRPLVC